LVLTARFNEAIRKIVTPDDSAARAKSASNRGRERFNPC
jgi:hypothetical protein